MHQSKKEILFKQWNQQSSFQMYDQIEKDILIEEAQFSREIGLPIYMNIANKHQH